MAMAPDLLHFRGREAFVRQPQPTDAVSYAFGSYHPVHHMRLAASAPDATRVQVFGATGVGEAIAWREMPLVGERLRQVHDLNQDTLAKAEAHAAALLDRTSATPSPASSKPRPTAPKSSTTSSTSTPRTPPPPRQCA